MKPSNRVAAVIALLGVISLGITSLTFAPFAAAQAGRSRTQNPLPPPPRQTPAPAQTPQEVDDDEVISIDTNLVSLTATITDKRGRFYADLKQGDFTVYEDGAPQKLAYFNTGDRVPVSLGIIFDTSGSMVDKIEGVRDAVEHFVKSVAPGDEIFLVRFSDDAELVQDFTDDRHRILRSIENLEPQGSTALYDATLLGLQRVAEGKHRKKALLLVTDGNDTASSVRFQTILELARKSEVLIYALGIGHGERGSFGHGSGNSGGHGGSSGHDPLGGILNRQIKDGIDMRVLNSFAATGGRAFELEAVHKGGRDLVEEATEQVAAELKQQYTLGYYPTNKSKDGGFRQIKIEVADKSLRVRTKRGYYAAADNATRS